MRESSVSPISAPPPNMGLRPFGALVPSILMLLIFSSWSLALPSSVQHTELAKSPKGLRSYHQARVEAHDLTEHKVTPIAPRAESIIPFQSFLDIGLGWNIYYSSWQAAALPVQPAAWALTNLYASMMLHARGEWRKKAPSHMLQTTFGQIQLNMLCPERTISWDLVENLASHMLSITEGGWTGLYKFVLSHAADDVAVAVELSILPAKFQCKEQDMCICAIYTTRSRNRRVALYLLEPQCPGKTSSNLALSSTIERVTSLEPKPPSRQHCHSIRLLYMKSGSTRLCCLI